MNAHLFPYRFGVAFFDIGITKTLLKKNKHNNYVHTQFIFRVGTLHSGTS